MQLDQHRIRIRIYLITPIRSVIFFTENHFTHKEMALMFGVSKRTVERRMQESQLSNVSRYTDIEDDMLDSFVQRIITNFPRSGK